MKFVQLDKKGNVIDTIVSGGLDVYEQKKRNSNPLDLVPVSDQVKKIIGQRNSARIDFGIYSDYAKPKYPQTKIATEVLESLEKAAEQKGIKVLFMWIIKGQEGKIPFLKAAGYKEMQGVDQYHCHVKDLEFQEVDRTVSDIYGTKKP